MSERWIVLAACAVSVGSAVAGNQIFPELTATFAVLGAALQILATVVAYRWHRAIVPILSVTATTATLAYAPIGWQRAFDSELTVWVPLMVMFATARLVAGVRRRSEIVIGTAALAGWLAIMIGSGDLGLLGVLGPVAPPLAGLSIALWQRLRQARRDRLVALARERELIARERVAAERSRMAADLHDTVTHQMVRVVLQARQLAGAAPDESVRSAAEAIAASATESLQQMREFLRSADDESPNEVADQLGSGVVSDGLARLVREHRALGHEVELDLSTHRDVRLPDPIVRCLLRAADEGLVNAAKHAPRSTVRLRWQVDEADATLSVVNQTMPGADADVLAGTGSGTGLRGLASRVHLLGGRLTAGEQDGAFVLAVTLPLPARGSNRDGRGAATDPAGDQVVTG